MDELGYFLKVLSVNMFLNKKCASKCSELKINNFEILFIFCVMI